MSNSIVRMEMSSISTSARCLSFCSELHFQSKALNKRSHKQLTDDPQPHKRKQVLCVCVKLWEACVRFKLMQGPQGMRTRPCQTAVWRQQAAGSSLTYSGRRSWDSAVRCFFDLRVWNEDEETTGDFQVNSFFLNLHYERDVRQMCVYARVRVQKKWTVKDRYFSISVPLK